MLRTTTLKGTTEDGYPATLTLEVDEPDPVALPAEHSSPLMIAGTTVTEADFPQLATDGRDAGSRFARTFSSPTEGILPWGLGKRKVPAPVAEFHSFKDWGTDATAVAAVTQLLDTMPAQLWDAEPLMPELQVFDPDGYSDGMPESDGISFLLTYFHEGERDFLESNLTVREWRRRHRLIYKTIRQHARGHRVAYVPIQTLTWTEAVSYVDDSGKFVPKGDRDPIAWWAGVGDYAGWDCYATSVTNKPPAAALYPAPAKFLELPLQSANSSGRPLFLPELGVIRQGSPADTGTYRADWMRQVATYLADHGCAGVAWWDALGSNSRDFRLTDAPSRAAWQNIIAGRF